MQSSKATYVSLRSKPGRSGHPVAGCTSNPRDPVQLRRSMSTSSPSFQKAATPKTGLTNEFLDIKVEGLGSRKGALCSGQGGTGRGAGVSDQGCLVLSPAHYKADGRGSGGVLGSDRDQAPSSGRRLHRPAGQGACVEPHANRLEGSLPSQGCREQ